VTHLRRMMLEELQRRHYSEATTHYYIRHVEAFARHFRRPPVYFSLERFCPLDEHGSGVGDCIDGGGVVLKRIRA
jgi:hypothetical protein